MVVETEILPILEWLFYGAPARGFTPERAPALWVFLVTALVLLLVGLVLGYLVAAFRNGPIQAFRVMGHYLLQAPRDLLLISPRRVLGLTHLAIREALRRRVWIALVLYAVILMFAGWILGPESDEPAKLYLNFVLTAATYLMIPVAIFASAFSLPHDIRDRTIYTITTKPVRPSEIVLGRILGFTIVLTVLLLVMAVASYVFVARGLDHVHQLTTADMVRNEVKGRIVYEGETSLDRRHRHAVKIEGDSFLPEMDIAQGSDPAESVVSQFSSAVAEAGLAVGDVIKTVDGQQVRGLSRDAILGLLEGEAGSKVAVTVRRGQNDINVELVRSVTETETEPNRGHTHRVVAKWSDEDSAEGQLTYEVGPPLGMLTARVPRYGRLRFRDKRGDPKDPSTWEFRDRADNVGKMFAYRSYIRGNTLAAAIWTFDGITPENYPNGLPLDLNIRVYRTHLGDMSKGITGSIVVRNPDPDKEVRSRERVFSGKEFTLDHVNIPTQLYDQNDQPIDLFDDLVTPDGRTEIWVSCLDPGQYFGMAQADVYLRAKEASYTLNFIKGFLGIWLQVALVTGLAVLFSTFLSGPIAMLLTVTAIVLGFNKSFLDRLALSVLEPEKMKTAVASHERVYGGGPVEAFYRIITQQNLISELDEGFFSWLIKKIDLGLMTGVDKLLHLLPDFGQFVEVKYLAHGYDIQGDLLLQHVLATIAFLIAAYVIGYFMLKTREMAQ